MPGKPARSNPEVLNYLQIRLPGWLKNQVLDHCEELDCTLNAWLTQVVISALREQKGLPEPPRGFAPRPTTGEMVAAWAAGEQVMTPCGKLGSCFGLENDPLILDDMSFCRQCDIRIA